VPVLVFVLAATTVAWLIFAPVDSHGDVVGAALSAIVIGANVFFHGQATDYFAGSDSPLIHLWSLSMEEQFYLLLIFAVSLLLVARRLSPKAQKISVTGKSLLILSLGVLGVVGLTRSRVEIANLFEFENFLFYFPIGRVWQFVAGIAVAVAVGSKNGLQHSVRATRWLAQLVVAILLAILLVPQDPVNAFLSWQRIGVTYLTAGVIYLNTGSHEFGILSRRALVAIGDRSYSIYLWHIPVISFWSLFADGTMNFVLAVLVVLTATELSYRLVERPFRSGHRPARSNWAIAYLSLVTVLASASIVGSDVIEEEIARRQPSVVSLADLGDRWSDFANNVPREECFEDPFYYACGVLDENTDVVLVGDSHALGISHAFMDAAKNLGLQPYVQAATGCYFLGSPSLTDPDAEYPTACEILTRTLQMEFEKRSLTVFVSECPRTRFEGCPDSQIIKRLDTILETRRRNIENSIRAGVKLVIIQELPVVIDDIRRNRTLFDSIVSRNAQGLQRIDDAHLDYQRLIAEDERRLASQYPESVKLFDPSQILCRRDSCLGLTTEGLAVWTNEDHLTIHGAELIRPALEAVMRDVTQP
jgi:peptidoglycan/LPS O-acetylase OafA/YrhL